MQKITNNRFLCHRDYRTTIPGMRIFFVVLLSGLAIRGSYPGSIILLAVMLLALWWSIRQWRFARSTWSLEGNKLRNTLLNQTRELDLAESHLISRALVQCIPIKDRSGYVQMHFYVFSRLPAVDRFDIIGYGGPGAVKRMIENDLFLLPVNEETTQMVRQRYQDRTIPEYPAYISFDIA